MSRLYTLNVMLEVAYGVFVPREIEHEKRESKVIKSITSYLL